MKLLVNGKEQNFTETKLNILELLKLSKIEMPDQVSVQLNGNFVDRNNFETTLLEDGNEVDFLYFLGGGAKK